MFGGFALHELLLEPPYIFQVRPVASFRRIAPTSPSTRQHFVSFVSPHTRGCEIPRFVYFCFQMFLTQFRF